MIENSRIVRFRIQRGANCRFRVRQLTFFIKRPGKRVRRENIFAQLGFPPRDRERVVDAPIVVCPQQREPFLVVTDADFLFDDLDQIVLLFGFIKVALFGINIAEQDRGFDIRNARDRVAEKFDGGFKIVLRSAGATFSRQSQMIVREIL